MYGGSLYMYVFCRALKFRKLKLLIHLIASVFVNIAAANLARVLFSLDMIPARVLFFVKCIVLPFPCM